MTDQREQSKRLSKHEIAIAVAVVGLTAIVFFPTLRWLVASWSNNPYYSHGFLVPLISAYFAWRKRNALKHRKPNNIGLAVLALGLAMHLLAFPWQAHPVSAWLWSPSWWRYSCISAAWKRCARCCFRWASCS